MKIVLTELGFFITMLKQVYGEYSERKPSYNQTQHQIILENRKQNKVNECKKQKIENSNKNRNSAWVLSCKFAAYIQNTFS